jgi:hypothetical protein
MNRWPAAIVFVIAVLTVCSSTVFAQSGPPDGPLRASLRREGARLIQGSAQAPKQRESWIVRHPVILGTLIGTGVGAGLSQTEAIGGRNHDPKVALLGAGVGAWGGLIASAVHTARTGQKVGVGRKIGIIAGAVGLVVVPALACYGAGGCGGSS